MIYKKQAGSTHSRRFPSTGISGEKAFQKIKHFCAYRERAHREVKEKLYAMGLKRPDVELIISRLIEENYLNEERFAIQFALGKFRIKQWGRLKIKYELKQKQVSEYCIRKALAEIDEKMYLNTLIKLAERKNRSLKSEKNIFVKKRKIQAYLLQKGYEAHQINSLAYDS